MADTDEIFNSGIMDISKLKVPDLKKELKSRGLSTTGNKTDLIARLQAALKSKLNDTIGLDAVDDLDEDLLNEDDDEHLDEHTEAVMHDLDSALEVTSPEKGLKRKLIKPPGNLNQDADSGPPKKIVLNRNPSVCSDTAQKQNGFDAANGQEKEKVAEVGEKKVIKLSELSVKERLEMRAKKFGVQLSSDAKKAARFERFGSQNKSNPDAINSNSTTSTVSLEVLQKRAERFGGSVSSVMSNLEKDKILEKRKERFGISNDSNKQSDKLQQRLERFKQPIK